MLYGSCTSRAGAVEGKEEEEDDNAKQPQTTANPCHLSRVTGATTTTMMTTMRMMKTAMMVMTMTTVVVLKMVAFAPHYYKLCIRRMMRIAREGITTPRNGSAVTCRPKLGTFIPETTLRPFTLLQ